MDEMRKKKKHKLYMLYRIKKLAAYIYHKFFWRLVDSEKENTNNIELSG